jgi:hypothetical protein
MLTDFNDKIIFQFQERLKQLQTTLESPDIADSAWQSQWHEIQQTFEEQMMGLNPEVINTQILPIWQSYLTEIHKQIRLLTIDLRFLKVARQTTTAQSRRTQIHERLNRLIVYCDAILAKISSV